MALGERAGGQRARLAYQVDVDAFTGGASVRIPVPITPARALTPALALVHGGGGNSIVGLGWELAGTPSITIDRSEHVPRWDGTDGVALGGVPLVPWLDGGVPRGRQVEDWTIAVLRPRRGFTSTAVERWTHTITGDVHYRSRDARNLLTIYGARPGAAARIADPDHPERVLEWLPELQLDPRGNAIWFEYAAETMAGVDRAAPWEPRRPVTTQRYLTAVRYGNQSPLQPSAELVAGIAPSQRWAFHVVVDYGDHASADGLPHFEAALTWATRADPYVHTRDGFELRTYRRVQRIAWFHHLPALGVDPVAAGALELGYDDAPGGARLTSVRRMGFRDGVALATQPIALRYAAPGLSDEPTAFPDPSASLSTPHVALVDLAGEGLPGLLYEDERGWMYRANDGRGRFAGAVLVEARPSLAPDGVFGDLDRDGDPEVALLRGRLAGAFELDREDARWSGFRPFAALPHVEAAVGRTYWVDLNGDGRSDVVVARGDSLLWFPSRTGPLDEPGAEFGDAITVPRPDRGDDAPLCGPDPRLDLCFADMNGDGMADLVRVGNGSVEYWPSLGNGRFGERVAMEHAPVLAGAEAFDSRRVRFVDLEGTGAADLLYIGDGELWHYPNLGGRRFGAGRRVASLPSFDGAAASLVDPFGDGRLSLVWSSPIPGRDHGISHLPLLPAVPPGKLTGLTDGYGREIQLEWGSSVDHYLRDRDDAAPWSTRLPSHRPVVDARIELDLIGGTRATTRYRYRDGYYDGAAGALRGFGRVDVVDAEVIGAGEPEAGAPAFAAPLLTRIWFHLGTPMWNHHRLFDPYAGDPEAPRLPPHVVADVVVAERDSAEALRALAGAVVRRERWAVGGAAHPIDVEQQCYQLVRIQPRLGAIHGIDGAVPIERVVSTYEQVAGDPRTSHEITVEHDAWGAPTRTASIAYPRRGIADHDEQTRLRITIVDQQRLDLDQPGQRFELGLAVESARYELAGLAPAGDRITRAQLRDSAVVDALAAPNRFDDQLDGLTVAARLLGKRRTYYWDTEQNVVLPLGELGDVALHHHDDDLAFSTRLIDTAIDQGVDAPLLASLGYAEDGDYWWRSGVTSVHSKLVEGKFGMPAGTARGDGATTAITYDADELAVIATTDAIGLTTTIEPDYLAMQPARVTDPNGMIAEVIYDALGATRATGQRGAIQSRPWGFDALATWAPAPVVDLASLVDEPEGYLDGAATAVWIDDDAWARDGTPPAMVRLARTSLRHGGPPGDTGGTIEIEVTYFDGFGRVLQRKHRVEPGLAIERDAGGEVALVDDAPTQAWAVRRWRVSGHVAYDGKGRPGRVFEPFFSPSERYESDQVLQRFGVSTLTRYDAAGRIARVDLPNGTHATTGYFPWMTEQASPGDNVGDSIYRFLREGLPSDDPERIAYQHALEHAGTTRQLHLDPRGLGCGTRAIGDASAIDRVTAQVLDADGRTVEIVDPRGLTAFRHVHDMLGRSLATISADAGTTRTLADAYDRPVRAWDPRGFRLERTFDLADRPRTVHIGGGPSSLDYLVEERSYGDDGPWSAAIDVNGLGRLSRLRDGSGVITFDVRDPMGRAVERQRYLRSTLDDAVDWAGSPALDDTFASSAHHDALGRPVREGLPDGSIRTYAYARGGPLAQIRLTSPDGALDETAVVSDLRHDADGRMIACTLGNGVAQTWQFDRETGRLVAQDSVRGPDPLQRLRFTYDPDGKLVRLRDLAEVVPGAVSGQRDFRYDAHGRLISATGRVHQSLLQHDYIPGTGGTIKGTRHLSLDNGAALERYTQAFSYDASGNLLLITHTGATQSWSSELWVAADSNRSLPAYDANGVAVGDPGAAFDASGNTIGVAHLRSMRWSWRGCLERAVVIERSGGPVDDDEVYSYGADRERVRKRATRLVVGGASPVVETREVTYLGDQELTRVRRNGTLVLERWTTHIRDGERRIAIVDRHTVDALAAEVDTVGPARIRYLLAVHQHSIAMELDGDGRLISYEEYLPHGGTAFLAGDDAREVARRDVRYCGKTRDDVTGLHAYPQRYYAPWLGRWLTPDPIGPADDLNLYQFVLGDPVGNVDPEGTDTFSFRFYGYEVSSDHPTPHPIARDRLAPPETAPPPSREVSVGDLFSVPSMAELARAARSSAPAAVDPQTQRAAADADAIVRDLFVLDNRSWTDDAVDALGIAAGPLATHVIEPALERDFEQRGGDHAFNWARDNKTEIKETSLEFGKGVAEGLTSNPVEDMAEEAVQCLSQANDYKDVARCYAKLQTDPVVNTVKLGKRIAEDPLGTAKAIGARGFGNIVGGILQGFLLPVGEIAQLARVEVIAARAETAAARAGAAAARTEGALIKTEAVLAKAEATAARTEGAVAGAVDSSAARAESAAAKAAKATGARAESAAASAADSTAANAEAAAAKTGGRASAAAGDSMDIQGAAASPKMTWRTNAPGTPRRTIDEAVEITRKALRDFMANIKKAELDDVIRNNIDNLGLDIGKNEYTFVEAKLPEGTGAEYFRVPGGRKNLDVPFSWQRHINADDELPYVKVSTDILDSDEAIIANLAHEVYEYNVVLDGWVRGGGHGTMEQITRLIAEAHSQAWTLSDEIIRMFRRGWQ